MSETVFVSNSFILDTVLFRLWLLGLNADQAISHCMKHVSKNTLPHNPSPSSIQSFIYSQYHNFSLLESALHHPKTLLTQHLFYLRPETRQHLVTAYYSFDERVIREFLSKKLTHRLRKELEMVSMKTKIPISGCRRMFDNVKRIVKRVEDAQGDILKIMTNEFCLPMELVSQYATIVFMNQYRFDTLKKKTAWIPLKELLYATNLIIEHLTENTGYAIKELDYSVTQDARDLKSLIFNQKEVTDELKLLVTNSISAQSTFDKTLITLAFNKILKPLFTIAASLSHSKDQRDCFFQLIEKCVEPLIQMGWELPEMNLFFEALWMKFDELTCIPTLKKRFSPVMKKLMIVFGGICTRFAEYLIKGR